MEKENGVPSKTGQVKVLIAGGFADDTVSIVESCIDDGVNVCGIMAHRKAVKGSACKPDVPFWFYDQLEDPSLFKTTEAHEQYEACLRAILSDPRTAYFCERSFEGKEYSSVFNKTVQVEIACWNSLCILKKITPSRLVYMNITHRLATWIFGCCAEFLGIPTYFTVRSPLTWRYWAVKGIEQQQVVDYGVAHETDANLSLRTLDFVERITQSYKVGMPIKHRQKLSKAGGRTWSWKREARQLLSWRPFRLAKNAFRLKRKYALYNTYSRLATPTRFHETYIVYFLHYQPEATTLPRGRGYVQQWLAVRSITAALPAGCHLVVKEHPVIYFNPVKEYTRHKSLYEAIAALPCVTLAPIEENPFQLIDSSKAVVTITGTAGIEAICRGKPVLALGAAGYRECPGVFAVNTIKQISEALRSILSGDAGPDRESLKHYLHWVEKYSVEGYMAGRGGKDEMAARSDTKMKIWKHLIRSEIDPPVVYFEHKW